MVVAGAAVVVESVPALWMDDTLGWPLHPAKPEASRRLTTPNQPTSRPPAAAVRSGPAVRAQDLSAALSTGLTLPVEESGPGAARAGGREPRPRRGRQVYREVAVGLILALTLSAAGILFGLFWDVFAWHREERQP